jgi:ABC-type antimicrobial peptide transport system permease subunit
MGIAASIALSRIFAHWTNGNVRDPWVLLAVVGVLLGAAVVASVAPALAATSIDPVHALRAE